MKIINKKYPAKKIILPVLFLFFIGMAAVFLCYQCFVHYTKKAPTLVLTTQKDFLHSLEAEYETIWQELQKLGISHEQYKKSYEKYLPDFIQSDVPQFNKKLSHATVQFVQEQLKHNGIDPLTIFITGFNDYSPAAATARVIYINEKRFNTLSLPARRHVINHEIAHIKEKDNFLMQAIEDMLQLDRDIVCKKNKNHPLCRLSRFKEKRADIKTALQSKQAAQDFLAFTQEYIQKYGDTPGNTHPKNSERLALAQHINDYFNDTNQTTRA